MLIDLEKQSPTTLVNAAAALVAVTSALVALAISKTLSKD